MLANDMEREANHKLLNVGSCGLHQIHNAFRAGSQETGWDIESILGSLHWLFKDSPARYEDFKTSTKCTLLPKKFCKHRWLDNVIVMERALEMWPHIEQYVQCVKSGTLPHPKNKSFEVVASSCGDPFFVAKGSIFLSIAKDLAPFLIKYQSDMPMLPFVQMDLCQLLRSVMERFVKQEVMQNIQSTIALMKLDVTDSSSHREMAKVDIGYIADRTLKDMFRAKK